MKSLDQMYTLTAENHVKMWSDKSHIHTWASVISNLFYNVTQCSDIQF